MRICILSVFAPLISASQQLRPANETALLQFGGSLSEPQPEAELSEPQIEEDKENDDNEAQAEEEAMEEEDEEEELDEEDTESHARRLRVWNGKPAVTLYEHDQFRGSRWTLTYQDSDKKYSSGWTYRVCKRCEASRRRNFKDRRGPSQERWPNDHMSSLVVHEGTVVTLYKHCCITAKSGQRSSQVLPPGQYGRIWLLGIGNDQLSYIRFKPLEDYIEVLSVTTCFQPLYSLEGGSPDSHMTQIVEWKQGMSHEESFSRKYARQAFVTAQATVSASSANFGASATTTAGQSYQSAIESAWRNSRYSEHTETRELHLSMADPIWIANVDITVTTNFGTAHSQGVFTQMIVAPENLCHTSHVRRLADLGNATDEEDGYHPNAENSVLAIADPIQV